MDAVHRVRGLRLLVVIAIHSRLQGRTVRSSVVGTVSRTVRRIAWLQLRWRQLIDRVHMVRLVDIVDDRTVAGRSASRSRSQGELAWLWAHATRGGLLVLPNLIRLVADQGTIVGLVQRGVALRVVDDGLRHMRRMRMRYRRQLREVLAGGVVALVELVAAAQRIRVVERVGVSAVNGAGVAPWPSGRDLVGVGPHRGGHFGARSGQDAIAQGDVL